MTAIDDNQLALVPNEVNELCSNESLVCSFDAPADSPILSSSNAPSSLTLGPTHQTLNRSISPTYLTLNPTITPSNFPTIPVDVLFATKQGEPITFQNLSLTTLTLSE